MYKKYKSYILLTIIGKYFAEVLNTQNVYIIAVNYLVN